MPVPDKLILGLFLTSTHQGNLLARVNPAFNDRVNLSLKEKLEFAGLKGLSDAVFPFQSHLSQGMNPVVFAESMLVQPDIFIRVRPGRTLDVYNKLKELGWDYKKETASAIRLGAGLPIDKNFRLNDAIVVQDLHSQLVGELIKQVFREQGYLPKHLWDCCAASGGKSIMMADHFPGLMITVSDIRKSIIQNLSKRFREAGIKQPRSFLADLSVEQQLPLQPTDFIIADVPCTGSGTWSRTPEQLHFFKEPDIGRFAERQYAIAKNACGLLVPGGWLVYITCSVFARENEQVVEKLLKDCPLHLVQQQLLDGATNRADSMFVAIMQGYQG